MRILISHHRFRDASQGYVFHHHDTTRTYRSLLGAKPPFKHRDDTLTERIHSAFDKKRKTPCMLLGLLYRLNLHIVQVSSDNEQSTEESAGEGTGNDETNSDTDSETSDRDDGTNGSEQDSDSSSAGENDSSDGEDSEDESEVSR